MTVEIICGDARSALARFPDGHGAYMHQVKEALRQAPPCELLSSQPVKPSLHHARVEVISFQTAAALIRKYEWLGNKMGTSECCFGLYTDGHLAGALSFGRVAGTAAAAILDDVRDGEVLTLARGATEWWAPPNSASYLIGRAARLLRSGVPIYRNWAKRIDKLQPKVLVAYADERAGEYGYVYQASNWTYTGLTTVIPVLLNTRDNSTRDIRLATKYSKKYRRTLKEQMEAFAKKGLIVIEGQAKHRYVLLLDRRAKHRLRLQGKPYPKATA